jgi:ComF family protein
MNKIFMDLADFILPRFCPSCNKKLAANEKCVCPYCIAGIKQAEPERLQLEYDRKFRHEKFITGFYAPYIFEKDRALQRIIHSFKYQSKHKNAAFMGELLGVKLKELSNIWKADFIIPAPLHPVKKAERGYNQAYYIAIGTGKAASLKVKDNVIRRKRYTESQTTMDLMERRENISGAFAVINKKVLERKNIILIDDVITTGSTLAECAKVLLESGANKVYAASIALAD